MCNSPLFSIISVCRNNLGGLEKTSKSLEIQCFKSFEWLVIDGGSQDGSAEFIQKNAPDFYLIESDNGPFDAMNKAIPHCKGTYTLFLNAGDILARDNTLESLAAALTDNPDFIYGDALESANGRIFPKKARSYERLELGMFTHHQSMLYKTALLQEFRYSPDYQIAADYNLTLRFLNRHKNVLYWPNPVCIFESGGLSQTKTKQGRLEQFRIRKANNLCSPAKNAAIYALQKLNLALRNLLPGLYWFSKRASRR